MIISHTTVVSSSQAPTTAIRNGSPLLERRIDEATAGLAASFAKQLHSITEDNAGSSGRTVNLLVAMSK